MRVLVLLVTLLLALTHGYPLASVPAMYKGSLLTANVDIIYYEQTTDHFDPLNTDTFPQKVLVTTDYYAPGGPMIVYMPGEAPMANNTLNVPFQFIALAKELNALLISREHRYYGESFPVKSLETKNLVFLSAEQALEDTIKIIQDFSKKYCSGPCPVVTIGGSYPGMLSAWMRLKYPHIVKASWASSAPIGITSTNGFMYLNRYSMVLKAQYPSCYEGVSQVIANISKLAQTAAGRQELTKRLQQSTTITEVDLPNLYLLSLLVVAMPVQYGNISGLCSTFAEFQDDPFEAFLALTRINPFFQWSSEIVRGFLSSLESLTPNPNGIAVSSRAWWFQMCTEIPVFFISPKGSVWPQDFDLDVWQNWCYQLFPELPKSTEPIPHTNWTIGARYGARDIKSSNTVFTNGYDDPVAAWNVLESLSDSMPAIVVDPPYGHGCTIFPSRPDDSESLKKARQLVFKYIKMWIAEDSYPRRVIQ